MRKPLSPTGRSKALKALKGWSYNAKAKALSKTFKFKDFSEAFGFMTRAALAAETLNHHPDWSNVYNKVEVRLSTHEAGGVTALDIRLADAMNKLAR